jgi:hypothetical protein
VAGATAGEGSVAPNDDVAGVNATHPGAHCALGQIICATSIFDRLSRWNSRQKGATMKRPVCVSALAAVCLFVLGSAHAESGDESLKTLPAPVQNTIRAERGQRSVVSIDAKSKGRQTSYKVIMKADNGMQKRLFVDASGKLFRVKNDVTIDAVPAAVRTTADANGKGGKFVRSTRIDHDGKLEYEVEYAVDGHSKVLLFDPAGQLKKVEEVVAISAIPAPARTEVEKEVGTGKLLKLKTITETGKAPIYEAQFESGGHNSGIKLASTGKILDRD